MGNRNPFRLLSILATAMLCFGVSSRTLAQKKANSDTPASSGSPVVIKTSKEAITLDDFEKAYKRMNDKDPYATTLDSLKDFLVIYGDYRLKLQEAHDEGLDKDPKIVKEMEGYHRLLAGPFVVDKLITEPAIETLYARRKYEVNAAHFLAMVHNWNDPRDTMKAYLRAMKAIDRMKGGETMSQIVVSDKQYEMMTDPAHARQNQLNRSRSKDSTSMPGGWEGSDDRSSAANGGSLGWFTAGQTIRPFEEAVFKLQPGEFTQKPIKTKFGYHVIQLIDRRIRLGGIKVHHILVAMKQSVKDADTLKYYHRIDSLYQAIKAGAKFEDVAGQSSDDKGSADRGGDLGTIDHENHRTEAAFDDAAYDLKDGQMTIVRTTRGYHILRRDEAIPVRTFDKDKDFLKKLYKNFYYSEDKDKLVTQIKKENHLVVDSANVNTFMLRIDSSRTTIDSGWARYISPGERGLTIYTLGGIPWKMSALIDSLTAQPGYALARNQVYEYLTHHLEDESIAIAAKDVDTKYPEFQQIMDDYKNGIMLFELENRKVWGKVKPDSLGEIKFYADHLTRFMWPERVDVSEIYILNDSVAKAVYKRIRDNGENFDTLAAHYTERPGFKEKAGHWGLLTKDENEMAKKAFGFTVDDVSQPFSYQAGYSIVKVNRRVPITQKTFAEARQEVASQYQDEQSNELRLKWVEELRKKYKRQINNAPVEEAYKTHHN